jgi:hypothetical protein
MSGNAGCRIYSSCRKILLQNCKLSDHPFVPHVSDAITHSILYQCVLTKLRIIFLQVLRLPLQFLIAVMFM